MRRNVLVIFLIVISIVACGKADVEKKAPSTIRFATWNIAHFNLGAGIENSISTESLFNQYRPLYLDIFKQVDADFINICEFESPFYLLHPEYSTRNTLFPDYNYYKDDATSFGAHCVAFFSRLPVFDVREVSFKVAPEGKYRYYLVGSINIRDKAVKVVCTHLTHFEPNVYAPKQLQQLIEDFDSEPYVIMLADWNSGPNDFLPLLDAGYTLANYYPNFINTYYSTEYYDGKMDNIAVKGGSILKSVVFNTNEKAKEVLSDHYLVYADVSF